MPELTDDAIRANLDALAGPPGGLGELSHLAASLCSVQQTLSPITAPRRLVLFAADHGPDDECELGPSIREMASGASATAVLAKFTSTDLVLVDVGSRCHPQQEAANYRCRKVLSNRYDHDGTLTADAYIGAMG
ncbi:MAG: nicotinate-nucleotide--dimethylbenzimidazole phosphoribosyltransferase, partial [Planctomycetes bacterium]|nr:nicotinate-nucleotide--dimethylbenzimidazole phosphoribosyltransferase [Planctomycetota bacterium]